MSEQTLEPRSTRLSRWWPWLILFLAAVPAVWHDVDFPDDADREFPRVARPTFSRRPPPAYRLAEPGDTIDRVAIYVASGATVLALGGLVLARRTPGLWPAAVALGLAGLWHASTPGPTFDGWHGLGWRTMFDPNAPPAIRLGLALAAAALAGLIAIRLRAERARWPLLWGQARSEGAAGLLVAAAVLVVLRQVEIPGVEPVGYWPRWAFVFGLIAFDLALVKLLPPLPRPNRLLRLGYVALGSLCWFGLVVGGIWMTWYHRPLDRLRTVVPGRIYISAMPTRRGLEVAHSRHHFRTIINLFPEDTPFRSPRLPEELRFAESHGIHYVGSPSDEAGADSFLDRTLALARDPDAWPILVHCHGCMDRTPAWMGIYRFVEQGRPLDAILREIEQHRGYRPKASVTLLYNRVLEPRAPGRYASDPTAALLRECARGTKDPYFEHKTAANPVEPPRVSRRMGLSETLPNLTLGRGSLEYQKTLRDPHLHDSANP